MKTYPQHIDNDLGELQYTGDVGPLPDATHTVPRLDGLALLPGIAVIGVGGFGKLVVAWLSALLASFGVYVPVLLIDNDHQLPDPIRLPDGRLASIAPEDFLPISTLKPRNALKDYPLLEERYVRRGLLRGISVFESHGRGGGGFPVISAIDWDLAAAQIQAALATLLRLVNQAPMSSQPQADFLNRIRGQAAPTPAIGPMKQGKVVIVGGGTGSNGPAGHILGPYHVRQVAADRKMREPYVLGVIAGPLSHQGCTPRTGSNWLATVKQIELTTEHGLTWGCIPPAYSIAQAEPPYDRILLVDHKPAGIKVEDEELRAFGAETAKNLAILLCSDVLDRIEGLAQNTRKTPWMTMRSLLVSVDAGALQALAAAHRSLARANSLADMLRSES